MDFWIIDYLTIENQIKRLCIGPRYNIMVLPIEPHVLFGVFRVRFLQSDYISLFIKIAIKSSLSITC